MARTRPFRPDLDRLEDRCLLDAGFRTIDGTGNNAAHTDWGGAGAQLLRRAPVAYADGYSTPAGADRPGPRAISNALVAHGPDEVRSDRQMSDRQSVG